MVPGPTSVTGRATTVPAPVETWENATAFIPAANIVRTTVEYLLDGQILANVFHVDANEAVDAVVTNAILDVFEDWLDTLLMPALSDDIAATGVIGRDLTTATGGLVERPFDTPIAGGVAVGALPNNVALCITLLTDQAGRSFRGRSYIAGLNEDEVTLSNITLATATAFATIYADLVDALSTAGFELVVTSFQAAGAPRIAAVSTPVTACGCNTVVDSQRRRLPGRGT